MKISSNDIPQADMLEDVVKSVIAVSHGARTFQEISEYINKVDRQGRYYRRAAEILGLIGNDGNSSNLTELGLKFIETGASLSNPILISAVLSIRIFQRLVAFLETKNEAIPQHQVVAYLGSVTEAIGETMLPRRASTLISWLESLNIIKREDHKIRLTSTISDSIPIFEFQDTDEPLLPKSGELNEYQIVEQRAKTARESIMYYKDQAKTDRAGSAHTHLVNLVAHRISQSGSIPKSNQIIDLATRFGDEDYIFEMKSITEENAKSQVRKGISQLYEYRYLQNIPSAKLILVTEIELPADVKWMSDYLESDRDILLLWDGNEDLYSSAKAKEALSFLW